MLKFEGHLQFKMPGSAHAHAWKFEDLLQMVGTYQVGIHTVPLLGGVHTPAYENLSKATFAELSVHIVFRTSTNLHLRQNEVMQ